MTHIWKNKEACEMEAQRSSGKYWEGEEFCDK